MATLRVTCSPAVHTDGTHHTVQIDPPGGPSQQADADGCSTFYNLTTGEHYVYVCGTEVGKPVVSGFSVFNHTGCP